MGNCHPLENLCRPSLRYCSLQHRHMFILACPLFQVFNTAMNFSVFLFTVEERPVERVRPEIPGSSGTRSRSGHSYRTAQARGRTILNVSGENAYGSSIVHKNKTDLLI